MFDGLAEATAALGDFFDPRQLERVVEALVPAIVFEPAAFGARRVGGTHLGGVPDVPEGFAWPRPPMPPDPQAIAGRANAHAAKEMLAHIERGLPQALIVQVDLGKAGRRSRRTPLRGGRARLPADVRPTVPASVQRRSSGVRSCGSRPCTAPAADRVLSGLC